MHMDKDKVPMDVIKFFNGIKGSQVSIYEILIIIKVLLKRDSYVRIAYCGIDFTEGESTLRYFITKIGHTNYRPRLKANPK